MRTLYIALGIACLVVPLLALTWGVDGWRAALDMVLTVALCAAMASGTFLFFTLAMRQ